jgi:hypothetical protein
MARAANIVATPSRTARDDVRHEYGGGLMSGGSFNYLFCWDARRGGLSSSDSDLLRMATTLEELPDAAVAAEQTRRVIRLLSTAEAVATSLSEVWHDIEWWHSGDYGQETAMETCRQYAAPDVAAPEGDRRVPDPGLLYRLVDVGGGAYELRAVARD